MSLVLSWVLACCAHARMSYIQHMNRFGRIWFSVARSTSAACMYSISVNMPPGAGIGVKKWPLKKASHGTVGEPEKRFVTKSSEAP